MKGEQGPQGKKGYEGFPGRLGFDGTLGKHIFRHDPSLLKHVKLLVFVGLHS